MTSRAQLVAIIGAVAVFLVVLEMVRQRRLMERYALLWLLSAIILIVLAIWRGALVDVTRALGIRYPSNALFVIAFGAVLILLLHFSSAVSRLSDQTKTLAQRLALLEERMRQTEEHPKAPDSAGREWAPAEPERKPPFARISSD